MSNKIVASTDNADAEITVSLNGDEAANNASLKWIKGENIVMVTVSTAAAESVYEVTVTAQ